MSIRIAEEIINGRRLNREDDLAFFMEEDLDSLCRGADEIRRRLRAVSYTHLDVYKRQD